MKIVNKFLKLFLALIFFGSLVSSGKPAGDIKMIKHGSMIESEGVYSANVDCP